MNPNSNNPTITSRKRRQKNLSDAERRAIYEYLLRENKDGKYLRSGLTKEAARMFSTSSRTVRRLWNESRKQLASGSLVDLSSKMTGKIGRKRVQIAPSEITNIPRGLRSNIRSLASHLKVSRATVHRRIKEGFIRAHSSTMKPYLTEENKRARLEFCLSMLNPTTLCFQDMYNIIHIDEKWFYMSKTTAKYYLAQEEEEHFRSVKSKRFIPKIMFLAVVGRPRFDESRKEIFSGKIGIFPFTFQEPAKRNSKNRAAGTLETNAILSITKDVIRSCLIEKVLPAIRAKWPRYSQGPIYIQQDNAKPHIDCSDAKFLEAASKDGFDIRLMCQPPNSPDLNVLDLGFFRSIQDLQQQQSATSIDELVASVEKSFHEYPSEKLNKVFLSQQMCIKEIMKINGGINYKLPHMGKDRLQRASMLPQQLECEAELVNDVLAYLEEQEH